MMDRSDRQKQPAGTI